MGLGMGNTAERIALIGLLGDRIGFLQSHRVCEWALEACELYLLPVPGMVLQQAGPGSFYARIALNMLS